MAVIEEDRLRQDQLGWGVVITLVIKIEESPLGDHKLGQNGVPGKVLDEPE